MNRIDEIRDRLDAWRNDGNSGEAGDYFDYYDIAWLLAEVERLQNLELEELRKAIVAELSNDNNG